MAEGGNVHDVGVARIDADARDGLRLLESEVRPHLAGVRTAIHAVALHDVAAEFRLAHADVDDVRIGLCDRDGAH